MYAVSDSFIDALKATNQLVAIEITASDGTELSVRSGSVSMDSTREIGRTCTLELLPTETMDADQVYNLMRTPGLEVTVKRGLIIDGQAQLVPLGVFSTDNAERSMSKTGSVKWNGSDRSKKIARNRFLDPYQITAGTTLAAAGTALLQSRLAGLACDFTNVIETINANITFEAGANSNPWKNARDLFSDYGYDLRFNGLGVAKAVPIPDPATQGATFDFGSGSTAMVLDGTAKTSLESVYNGVVASGEGSDVPSPVRAVVWDTDPSSPTYYLSGFGQVPLFYSSPLLTTEADCLKAATTRLSKVKGRFQQLAWPSLVNPALEPLDIVTVTFWDKTSTSVLDSITIPLGVGESMSASARETAIA